MIEPEKTEDTFARLAEDFARSARKISTNDGLSMDGLMAKFDILWRFKAENSLDQQRLIAGLYEGGMDILRKIARADCREHAATNMSNFSQIFTFITKPEYMQFLPDTASEQLADGALSLIAKSENVKYEYQWNDWSNHKNELIAFARSAASFAEKTQGPRPPAAAFAIAKPLAPAKRLTPCQDGR